MIQEDQQKQELLERLAEQITAREQERPDRRRFERKGRIRNKYRLLEKWETALESYTGPGRADLVTGYRPTGFQGPVDVAEIAGLLVQDESGVIHHFRLYRDETVAFLEIPDDPDDPIHIDPMMPPPDERYTRDGPPPAVTEVLDALGVTPKWHDACHDRQHTFVVEGEDTRFESVVCGTCGNKGRVLSWLGHSVPAPDEFD